jgi:hypothetical protein
VQANCSGKVNPAIFLVALLLLLGLSAAWMAFGKKSSGLPENPALTEETFGSSIRIGMNFDAVMTVMDRLRPETATEAEIKKIREKTAIEIQFFTPEELANHNLYKEHSPDDDLVAVIMANTGEGEYVQGLRAYLGKLEAEGERATLSGQFAANLSVEEVKQIYGKPFSETPEQNGRTHLVYYFGDSQDLRLAYKLTTSHDYTGKIFSMALERVLAPQ